MSNSIAVSVVLLTPRLSLRIPRSQTMHSSRRGRCDGLASGRVNGRWKCDVQLRAKLTHVKSRTSASWPVAAHHHDLNHDKLLGRVAHHIEVFQFLILHGSHTKNLAEESIDDVCRPWYLSGPGPSGRWCWCARRKLLHSRVTPALPSHSPQNLRIPPNPTRSPACLIAHRGSRRQVLNSRLLQQDGTGHGDSLGNLAAQFQGQDPYDIIAIPRPGSETSTPPAPHTSRAWATNKPRAIDVALGVSTRTCWGTCMPNRAIHRREPSSPSSRPTPRPAVLCGYKERT